MISYVGKYDGSLTELHLKREKKEKKKKRKRSLSWSMISYQSEFIAYSTNSTRHDRGVDWINDKVVGGISQSINVMTQHFQQPLNTGIGFCSDVLEHNDTHIILWEVNVAYR